MLHTVTLYKTCTSSLIVLLKVLSMPRSYRFLLWIMLLWPSWQLLAQATTKGFYQIPAQSFNYFAPPDPDIARAIMTLPRTISVSVADFSISKQISLSEYRQFVGSQPSGIYDELRPDTSITHAEAYRAYWETDDYDEYPALGISWDNAMAYCQWRTLEEQRPGSYSYYYTLPTFNQWIGAFRQLDRKRKKHDFNKDYADWLRNSYVFEEYNFRYDLNPDLYYQDNEIELFSRPNRLAVGASYHRQLADILNYKGLKMTKERGYPDVGFRIVKVILPQSEEERTEIDKYFVALWQLR